MSHSLRVDRELQRSLKATPLPLCDSSVRRSVSQWSFGLGVKNLLRWRNPPPTLRKRKEPISFHFWLALTASFYVCWAKIHLLMTLSPCCSPVERLLLGYCPPDCCAENYPVRVRVRKLSPPIVHILYFPGGSQPKRLTSQWALSLKSSKILRIDVIILHSMFEVLVLYDNNILLNLSQNSSLLRSRGFPKGFTCAFQLHRIYKFYSGTIYAVTLVIHENAERGRWRRFLIRSFLFDGH